MPVDYKRFNGPEDSIPYQRFIKSDEQTYKDKCDELLDENQHRRDGRDLDETRKMFAITDLVSQAKGSSYVELKETKVACSVFDPREIPHQNEFSQLGQIFCEVKYAPYSCKGERRSPVPDAEEKALSVALRKALEPCVCRHLFPNFQIDILVYILANDGACLAAAINAAGLALSNAAVPIYDVIVASSLAVIGDKVLVDPTHQEEALALSNTDTNTNHGTVTMSILPALNQITDFRQVGSMDMQCVTKCLDDLEKECHKILPYMQKIMVTTVVRNIDQNKHLEEEAKKREEILNSKMGEWMALLNVG